MSVADYPSDADMIYRRIGEFVVGFQWMEHRLREIGWLILDPHRNDWPPRALRDEANHHLVNRVKALYVDLVDALEVEDQQGRKADFSSIAEACHVARRQRNRLLHSAYFELKGGGEVRGVLRSDPKIEIDPDTGEPMFDRELLSVSGLTRLLQELAQISFRLNMHYVQLIHWAPFEHLRRTGRPRGGALG
jgi:hypothetical protein